MKLKAVTLKNFRCYKDEVRIGIADLTTIIGKNGAGKSAILEALEIFFNNDAVKFERDDLNVSARQANDTEVAITCEFKDFPDSLVLDKDATTTLESEYLLTGQGTLKICKKFDAGGEKVKKEEVFVVANHPTAKPYHDLLKLNNPDLKKRLSELGEKADKRKNPDLRKAIWKHSKPSDLQLSEIEIPVKDGDGKQIWAQLKGRLPVFALFRSDRASLDSDDEVQGTMKATIQAALRVEAIQKQLQEIKETVRAEAESVATGISEALNEMGPQAYQNLSSEFKSDPVWDKVFSVTLKNDQKIPINKHGSGIRRMILIGFFRDAARRRQKKAGSNSSVIYAIEEPETSQHPDSQRILLKSFQDLAHTPKCQVMITTHSPNFAGYLPIDSFRFVKQSEQVADEAFQVKEVKERDEKILEDIVDTLGVEPSVLAPKVILYMEGKNDVETMQQFSKTLHADDPTIPDLADNPQIICIPVGGSSLKAWQDKRYLKSLRIPEAHIYDNDVKSYGEVVKDINNRGDGSWAELWQKKTMENYFHSDVIDEVFEVNIQIQDSDDVPNLICKKIRAGKRRESVSSIKNRLANEAAPKMTAAQIHEADQYDEIVNHLRKIETMLRKQPDTSAATDLPTTDPAADSADAPNSEVAPESAPESEADPAPSPEPDAGTGEVPASEVALETEVKPNHSDAPRQGDLFEQGQ